MVIKRALHGVGLGLALLGGSSWAANPLPSIPQPVAANAGQIISLPNCPPPTISLPSTTSPQSTTQQSPTDPSAQAQNDAFAQANEAGTEAGQSFTPQMIGDFAGPAGSPHIRSSNSNRINNLAAYYASYSSSSNSSSSHIRVPVIAGGPFKIAENESPRPDDRVFLTYNYFNDVWGSLNRGSGVGTLDLHREVFGFEKTLLGTDASIGMRLPVLQLAGDGSFNQDDFGDITIIMKYALINDRQTGNVLSGGLAVTAPTGPDFVASDGETIHSVLLQPWAGYILNVGDLYLHGFWSLVIPTDSHDATIMFNDIGLGYWLYRTNANATLGGIVPTIEAHVTTPFDNCSRHDVIYVPEIVVLTGGVHFVFLGTSTFTLGAAAPITGPKEFDIEAYAQLNIRF